MGYHIVGVDLGGTKIATALLDTDLEVVARDVIPTEASRGVEAVVEQIVASVGRVGAGQDPNALLGVGVAAAGLIEPESGKVLFSPHLAWHDVPLRDMLHDRLGLEVYVDNDVNMAALGELHFGAGRGCQHMVCVFVGTGIGAGIVAQGHLYRGAHGLAGEVGHTSIAWDGPLCVCGNHGCWELFASGTAMRRRAREALDRGEASQLSTLGDGVEALAAADRAGDALAGRIVQETGEWLGVGLANLINLLNPERIVLGGGVLRGVPQLLGLAEASARRRALPASVAALQVVPAHFGREAGVIGAGVLVKLAGKP